MKKITFLIVLITAIALMGGCTQSQKPINSGDGLMTLTGNNDTNTDSNRGTQIYNNLNTLIRVKTGDAVAVNYIGRLSDGSVFDTSVGKTPLEFIAGAGQMIKGFDDAVIGMKVGEIKNIQILPAEGYGEYDLTKVVTLDKNNFSNFDSITKGMKVAAENIQGVVIEKNDKNAVVDFNHKLAGKTLIFEITLVSIN